MNSYHITVFTKENDVIRKLIDTLIRKGYVCNVISYEEELNGLKPTDLLLLDSDSEQPEIELKELAERIKHDRNIKILLLAPADILQNLESIPNIDDFVLKPYDINELLVRINRLLYKHTYAKANDELLISGDIVIDVPRCEVSVAGRIVDLTFTEYELLKLLMTEKGHVLSREVLLNKIWGYDYFGGDRTVDVHITRLRNKIEDPAHSFIETVRNIGYRIKAK